jgi:hypothetical protein
VRTNVNETDQGNERRRIRRRRLGYVPDIASKKLIKAFA